MKILKKTLVAAGIATAVSATGAAQAATITNHDTAATAAAPTFGDLIVNEVTRSEVDLQTAGANNFILQLGAGEALAEDDSLILTLSNGATWKAIVSGSILNNAVAANFALVSGGAGTSSATFRVTGAGGVAAANPITINEALTTLNMSAVPADGSVTISAAMSGFVGGVATSLYGSPLSFNAVDMEAARSATVTAATAGIFGVATGFTTLTTNATASTASTSSAATVAVINSGAAIPTSTTANGAGLPTAAPTVGANFVTISGPMTGVSAINSGDVNQATSAGVALAPVVPGFAVDSANNAAYGVLNALAAGGITITFDGTVVYDLSAYSANVATLLDGSYPAVASIGSGTTHAFARNGSTFTTNSFGSLNKITVTDLSGAVGAGGADGAIVVTAYDAAGAMVTCTGLTPANLAANGTTTIQGADVMAACPDAKRIDGLVNSTSIQTTNTKIATTGATSQSGVNVSSAISN
jgi:hypothetical protein